jgi:hypothetical protein
VINVLAETGHWLARDPDGLVADALRRAATTSPLPFPVLKRSFELLPAQFDLAQLEYQIERELGGPDILDGWREMPVPASGRRHRVRAYPARIVHGIRGMNEYYRIWGDYRGAGLVIRSEEPVDFHPDGRVVNVVVVSDLANAIAT